VYWGNTMNRGEKNEPFIIEQEIHHLHELLITRKDMLCLSMGNTPFEAVYVELHYLVGVQNGSNQIHLRKARSYWENSSMAGFVVGVRYCLCHSEDSKRERFGRLSGSIAYK